MCILVCVCIPLYIYIYVYTYVHIHSHTHTLRYAVTRHVCVCIYIYIYIYIYMYMYIYICIYICIERIVIMIIMVITIVICIYGYVISYVTISYCIITPLFITLYPKPYTLYLYLDCLGVNRRRLAVDPKRFPLTHNDEACRRAPMRLAIIIGVPRSYPILSFPILLSYSCPVYPVHYPILRYPSPILSYPILSYISYPILSYPILSSISYPILSYPILIVVRLELGCSTDSLDRPAVYYRQASYLSISLPQLAGQRLKLAS